MLYDAHSSQDAYTDVILACLAGMSRELDLMRSCHPEEAPIGDLGSLDDQVRAVAGHIVALCALKVPVVQTFALRMC